MAVVAFIGILLFVSSPSSREKQPARTPSFASVNWDGAHPTSSSASDQPAPIQATEKPVDTNVTSPPRKEAHRGPAKAAGAQGSMCSAFLQLPAYDAGASDRSTMASIIPTLSKEELAAQSEARNADGSTLVKLLNLWAAGASMGSAPAGSPPPSGLSATLPVNSISFTEEGGQLDSLMPRAHRVVEAEERGCSTVLGPVCVTGRATLSVLGATAHKSSTALQCNEGVSGKANPRLSVETTTRGPSSESEMGSRGLHVALCWDYYGYHLWLCLLGVHAKTRRLERKFANTNSSNSLALLNAAVGSFDVLLVPSDVSVGTAQSLQSKFMVMWKAILPPNTSSSNASAAGSSVVFSGAAGLLNRCYRYAFIGSASPTTATGDDWRSLQRAVLEKIGKNTKLLAPMLQCRRANSGGVLDTLNVVVVDRKHNNRILNVKDVVGVVKETLVGAKVGSDAQRLTANINVSVVLLEELPIEEQVAVVRRAQIVIGLHGNGLTWTGLLERGQAVLIEVWTAHAFNGNYRSFADNIGFKYIGLEHSRATRHASGGGRRRRGDAYINTLLLQDALAEAAAYLTEASARFCSSANAPSTEEAGLRETDGISPRDDVTTLDVLVGRDAALDALQVRLRRVPPARLAQEDQAALRWMGLAKSAKLWMKFGVQKKHFSASWDLFGNSRISRHGLAGALGIALRTLKLSRPLASTSPEELNLLRRACSACTSIYSPGTKAGCLLSCTVVHRLQLCHGYVNALDNASISGLEDGLDALQKQEGTAQQEADEANKKNEMRIKAKQAQFFESHADAKAFWNKHNGDDPYA